MASPTLAAWNQMTAPAGRFWLGFAEPFLYSIWVFLAAPFAAFEKATEDGGRRVGKTTIYRQDHDGVPAAYALAGSISGKPNSVSS